MKKLIRLSLGVSICSFALFMLFVLPAKAQNQFEDAIEQLESETVTGYLQPFLNGFGANLNSGFSGSAKLENKLVIRLEAVGMATLIGTSEETFNATPPAPFAQQTVETATIFGDQGATVSGPEGVQYKFQNGVFDLDYFPLAVPQLTLGNYYHSQLQVRFFGYTGQEDVPDIQLLGFGIRHGLNQYFEELPLDLAAGLFYQQLEIGDIMKSTAYSITGMASKEFGVLSIYGGAQYEKTQLDLTYTRSGSADTDNAEVDLSFDADNTVRAFAGLNLDLRYIHLRADMNIGSVSVLSISLGFGI